MDKLEELKKAAEWLHEDDPEWVEGGCADVSGLLLDYAAERGMKGVRALSGTSSRRKKGGGFPHVWLTVDGVIFDPVAYAQGLRFAIYEEGDGGRLAVAGSYLDNTCEARENNQFRLRGLVRGKVWA